MAFRSDRTQMIEVPWTEFKLSHEIPHALNGGQDTTQIQVERTCDGFSISPSGYMKSWIAQRLVFILPWYSSHGGESCKSEQRRYRISTVGRLETSIFKREHTIEYFEH